MKANELMIGDWVYYNPNVFIEDEYEPTKPIKITKITSGEDIDLAIEGCYSPIPLTAEILEKNGFVNNDGDFRFFKADEESYYFGFESVHYYFVTHFCNVTKEFSQGGMQNQSKGIFTYVHQLQHALRLCGIEKEITLK